MRRIGDLIPVIVLGAIGGIAIWATANGWSSLLDEGGWYALLGQFLAVAATLAFLFVACVLRLTLLALPLLLLFGLSDQGRAPGGVARRPADAFRTGVSGLARAAYAIANALWKTAWWGWWFVGGIVRPVNRDGGR